MKHYTWGNTLRVWWCYLRRHRWSFDICKDCFARGKQIARERW